MKDHSVLRMQHTSLQFSDTDAQQLHDVRKLFKKGKRFPIKTGTEALAVKGSGNSNRRLLVKFAEEHNHAIHFSADTWVAVDRRIVVPNSLKRSQLFLADNRDMVGAGADRKMAVLSFDHVDSRIGRINVGSVHYPRFGSRRGDPNYELNQMIARRIADWFVLNGKGKDLAFLNGDFNLKDHLYDWSYGGNFTSLADQLGAWKNTGHGPIDGFTSYDKDGRVKPKAMKVFPDKKFFMHSDHYLCRGFWYVKHLPK